MRGLTIAVSEDGYTVSEFDGELNALQAAVGGWIEPVPTDESVTMWVNEEGKLMGLPINRLAMDVWLRWDVHRCQLLAGEWLAGSCVVTGGVDRHGNTLDITDDARRWVLAVARDAGVAV